MNGKIMYTLLKKDIKSCLANKNILVSVLIPIFFCALYCYLFSGIGEGMQGFVLNISAIFAISIIPTSILPIMIAEEKEKYTLRSLMLAHVRGHEFLTSKILVCLGMTAVVSTAVFFIAGGDGQAYFAYLAAAMVSAAGLCFLGAMAGLLSKDQASAGTISAPLTLLTMLPPLFSGFNDIFERISAVVPTTSFQTIYTAVQSGQNILSGNSLTAIIVCAVWIAGGAVLFDVFYRRKGIDC